MIRFKFAFGSEVHTIACKDFEEVQQLLNRFEIARKGGGTAIFNGGTAFYFVPADTPRMIEFDDDDPLWGRLVEVWGTDDAKFRRIVDGLGQSE